MQLRNLFILAFLVLYSDVQPTAVTAEIISSKPDQLIYLIGQNHRYQPEQKEQFKTLMEIVEGAEKKEESEFHFLVEHGDVGYNGLESCSKYGDMNACLLPEVQKRNFQKSVFEDIEIRYLSGQAYSFLKFPDLHTNMVERYKKGKDYKEETYTKEQFERDLVLKYPNITAIQKRIFLDGFKGIEPADMTDERWQRLTEQATLKKGTERILLDQLTFNDVFNELSLQIADLQNYMLTLSELEQNHFRYIMNGLGQRHSGLVGNFTYLRELLLKQGVKPEDKVLEFSRALEKAKRKSTRNTISNVNSTIMDLNLYRRILQLRQTNIKKIVVISGREHSDNVASLLISGGLDKYKLFKDCDYTIKNNFIELPLRIEYLKLLEPPVGTMQDTLFIASYSCTLL